MDGRRRARRSDATTRSIVALAMVLALVFVPSMGPGAVPAGLASAVAPAAAVVHALGDEVVAAAPALDLRARPSLPGPLLATLVLVAGLGAVLLTGRALIEAPAHVRALAFVTTAPGRSPPRRVTSR